MAGETTPPEPTENQKNAPAAGLSPEALTDLEDTVANLRAQGLDAELQITPTGERVLNLTSQKTRLNPAGRERVLLVDSRTPSDMHALSQVALKLKRFPEALLERPWMSHEILKALDAGQEVAFEDEIPHHYRRLLHHSNVTNMGGPPRFINHATGPASSPPSPAWRERRKQKCTCNHRGECHKDTTEAPCAARMNGTTCPCLGFVRKP